ncbi:pentapeptide repeat-containing protein [Streptomyces sp. AC558_RSS880]|uniref:pentapeptide repeat-containing protein n=1 Tax=Streptomyces sp. AC558_RSS880 TaxID=2823687 RepID=UPI001C243A9C|nr:pentapeptide repeat-containing protein [Streptomyces sp. AC558_RSS880]
MTAPNPPSWQHCGHGANPEDPVGCRGIRVRRHRVCLAHLPLDDRRAYLRNLAPGRNIDYRGTPFTDELLTDLLRALRDRATRQPCFGTAKFDEATFTDTARFEGTTFTGNASFESTVFNRGASFGSATFADGAYFHRTVFTGGAHFSSATFSGSSRQEGTTVVTTGAAWFGATIFTGSAWFEGTTFNGSTVFGATFAGEARFNGATFTGDAQFNGARFEAAPELGPLACEGEIDLSGAVFGHPVTIEMSGFRLVCRRTRWSSVAALRLRCATVDLSYAVPEFPLSVTALPEPLRHGGSPLEKGALRNCPPSVRLESVRGVDAAHLVLTDIDLSTCLFSGSVHLDQLTMAGECPLAEAPGGMQRCGWLPVLWTARRTLAEEQHWRHSRGYTGWDPAPPSTNALRAAEWPMPGPATLAPVYRQLRKALEDSKNEPDAADFYYGEMEMRRNDPARPLSEHVLLTAYWAVSGYGLRASRALAWLLLTMAGTILALMLWGIPQDRPKPTTTGRITGPDISLTTNTPAPLNPTGPLGERFATDRFEKSLRTVINSVVFRSSGQHLTTVGTYTEMASRFVEPVLLALAILAVRGRVKR